MKLSNVDQVVLAALHSKGSPSLQQFWMNKVEDAFIEDMEEAFNKCPMARELFYPDPR